MLAVIHAAAFPAGKSWSEAAFDALLAPPLPAWGRLAADGAGFALLRTVVDETELLAIGVLPARRRAGIGAVLLRAGLEARPPGPVFLEVEAANRAAIALYRRAGFGPAGRRPGYYGPGRDALLMRLAPAAPACAARAG